MGLFDETISPLAEGYYNEHKVLATVYVHEPGMARPIVAGTTTTKVKNGLVKVSRKKIDRLLEDVTTPRGNRVQTADLYWVIAKLDEVFGDEPPWTFLETDTLPIMFRIRGSWTTTRMSDPGQFMNSPITVSVRLAGG